MTMNYKSAVACALLTMTTQLAFAGEDEEAHFDIFIGRPVSGTQTLIGGAQVPGELNLTERIFEGDLGTDLIGGNNFYTGAEPGFFNAGENSPGLLGATNPAGALPLLPGESFEVIQQTFEIAGSVSSLFYWDGAGSVNFTPAAAELIITQTDGAAGSDGSIDDHPIFDIDDPLSPDLPAGGIYLASLTAQLDGLEPSDPAFVLLVTGEEFEASVELAEDFLAGGAIPEPSTAVLAGLAAIGGFVATRRRM